MHELRTGGHAQLALVVLAAQRRPREFQVCVVRTSQHREMLDQVLADFLIWHADFDLDVMRSNQDLAHVTSEVLCRLRDVILTERPDWAVVQRHDDRVRRRVGCIL